MHGYYDYGGIWPSHTNFFHRSDGSRFSLPNYVCKRNCDLLVGCKLWFGFEAYKKHECHSGGMLSRKFLEIKH